MRGRSNDCVSKLSKSDAVRAASSDALGPIGSLGSGFGVLGAVLGVSSFVVDFFDATRCDRPYRLGMKREDSIGLLRKMAGSSFDPRVVDMFAQRAIVPASLSAMLDRGTLRIELEVANLPRQQVAIIAAKLAGAVAISAIEVEEAQLAVGR